MTYAWPAGSEVLVSAITHPAMASLVTQAGLVPVAVELDLETLLPDPATRAVATTGRTRAVLVVQLFGGLSDLAAVAGFCRERGLLLVEDAAQAWCGPATLRSAADVTLVSFGLIMTATAVGGAVLRVSDPALLRRLRRTHLTWSVQTRSAYAGRLVRALTLLVIRLHRGRRRPQAAAAVGAARDAGPATEPLRPERGPRPRPDGGGGVVAADLAAGFLQPGARAVRKQWLFPVRAADPPRWSRASVRSGSTPARGRATWSP